MATTMVTSGCTLARQALQDNLRPHQGASEQILTICRRCLKVDGDAGLAFNIIIHSGHLQAGEYAGEVGAANPR
jgi:hypothetical protein